MDTLARRLSRSPRTIQRHLHLLKEKGLVEFVERKRDGRGRFGAYLYRVVHIAAATARKAAEVASRRERRRTKRSTTGHGGRVASNKRQTKRQEDTPLPPKKDPKEGYWGGLWGGPLGLLPQRTSRRSTTKRQPRDEKGTLKGVDRATNGSSSSSLVMRCNGGMKSPYKALY